MGTYEGIHVEHTGKSWVLFLEYCPPWWVRQGLIDLELPNSLDRLAMSSREPPVSVSAALGLEARISISHSFAWALGSDLRSLRLCVNTLLTLLSPSSLLYILLSE